MRHITIPAIWLACFLNVTTLTEGARILAIITVPSYSHQIPFQSLWASLSQRGHQVVVLTTDPIGDPSLTNLTEIDFRHHYNIFKKIDFAKLKFTDTWLTITRNYIWDNFEELVKSIFEHPEVRKLYAPNSGEHFDVIFVEVLMSPAIYALAHRFNAPIIGKSHDSNLLYILHINICYRTGLSNKSTITRELDNEKIMIVILCTHLCAKK